MTMDGIYAAYMTGTDGQGFAMFVFHNGILSGADPLGVRFDGMYQSTEDGKISATIKVTVPPEGTVVQGVSVGSSPLIYEVPLLLEADLESVGVFRLDTPLGPVNVKLEKLRGL
jgi:hypothetical protein